mmetsp:Transcript_4353/g.15608  ORF Transcript_4353/g.15608 Transcript_4353/m.15608 type:complete len:385 (+) Transcript_4353:554-1708(+)
MLLLLLLLLRGRGPVDLVHQGNLSPALALLGLARAVGGHGDGGPVHPPSCCVVGPPRPRRGGALPPLHAGQQRAQVQDLHVVQELAHLVAPAEDHQLGLLHHAGGVPHPLRGRALVHPHQLPLRPGLVQVQQVAVVEEAGVAATTEKNAGVVVHLPQRVPEPPGGRVSAKQALPPRPSLSLRSGEVQHVRVVQCVLPVVPAEDQDLGADGARREVAPARLHRAPDLSPRPPHVVQRNQFPRQLPVLRRTAAAGQPGPHQVVCRGRAAVVSHRAPPRRPVLPVHQVLEVPAGLPQSAQRGGVQVARDLVKELVAEDLQAGLRAVLLLLLDLALEPPPLLAGGLAQRRGGGHEGVRVGLVRKVQVVPGGVGPVAAQGSDVDVVVVV